MNIHPQVPHQDPDDEIFDDKSRYLDRFGLLLTLVSATIVLASLVHLPHESDVITNFGVMLLAAGGCLVLILAIHATGVSRRWRRISEIVIGLMLAIQLTTGAFALLKVGAGNEIGLRVPPLGALAFAIGSFVLVVYRVLHHTQVSMSTVLAAVTGYLLIPLVFFDLFLSMEILLPGEFFKDFEASPEFMYFSLTTITTLGSPLEASTDFGRLMTAVASILGQLYLVVFVALIVGLMSGRWAQKMAANSD